MRMIALPGIRAVAVFALVVAASISPAAAAPHHASSAASSRIDNVWGWRDHQPTEAEARSLEPHDPAHLRARREGEDEVNQLYQQLMRESAA